MGKKIITAALFILLTPFFVFPEKKLEKKPEKKPAKELLLKTRIGSEKGIETLASLGNSTYQILFMGFEEDPKKRIFNIYTPYADLGRITSAGLLKEIKNPAAHYPGSQVFNEKTKVLPDRVLKRNGNSGIRIDAGNLFSIFSEEGESAYSYLAWKGVYSGQQIGKNASINFAITEYNERDDTKRDIWYSDRKVRYGRRVINSAFSTSYKTGSFGVSGAGVVNHYNGASNGIYARVSPYVRFSFVKLDFLLSGTNDSYIKPDGAFASTAVRKGVSALVTPASWLKFNARYVTDVLHKKESDTRYGGYTEEILGSVVLSPWFFESGASVRNRNIYKDNYFDEYIDTAVFIGVKAGLNKIIFEKKDTYKDSEKISQTYRLEAGAMLKNISLYMLGKIKEGTNEKETDITSKVKIKVKNVSLFYEYKSSFLEKQNKPDKFSNEYSVGLDAKF